MSPARTLLCSLALMGLTACSTEPTAPAEPAPAPEPAPEAVAPAPEKVGSLRYGGQYYPAEWLLQGNTDLWAKRGLEVEHTMFASAGEANEALIAGNIDVVCGADTRAVSMFNAIPDQALIIGVVHKGKKIFTMVGVGSTFQSWDDLKGKKVATKFGTGAEGAMAKFWARDGYERTDFELINMGLGEMTPALENGQIDAFTAWEPTPAIAEAKGVGRVLRSYEDISLVPSLIYTTKAYAEAHPAELAAFLAAHMDKQDLIESDPAGAAGLAATAASAKGVDVPAGAFETVYGRMTFEVAYDQAVIDTVEGTAAFMVEKGKIEAAPTLAWDDQYLKAAQALRGEAAPAEPEAAPAE
jgi:ABC-type nitrate/sulfonate/bicarbonate transport system substrate-binding protein